MADPSSCQRDFNDLQLHGLSRQRHNYVVVDEEYDSLENGGSYEVLRCTRCHRIAYQPLAD